MSGFDRDRLADLPAKYREVIMEFEKFKYDTGTAEGSVPTYLNRVTAFFEWLVEHADAPDVEQLEEQHTLRYARSVKNSYEPSVYRHRIITTNHLFEVVGKTDKSIWTKAVKAVPDSQEVRDSHKHGRGLDTADMSQFFRNIQSPLWHAYFLTQLKTMARTQETANMLLSEIHIDDPDIKELYDDLDVTLHSKVSHHPDTLYIPSNRDGNKRKSETRIPIDAELKAALIRWLTIRPITDNSVTKPRPLFVSLGDNWGEALSSSSVSLKFGSVAPDSWRPDDNPFTPHDFRHWTNRHLRGNISDRCLSYLRGDAPDMLTHYDDLVADYEEDVRQPYLRHVPQVYS